MGRIEKTVFISYRRTNYWTALAIFQNLHANGYDVFFDYKSIPSGDFEQAIVENIKSRAHFLVILSPSALERCNEPGDWLRREMEAAIDNQRNIIPLIMEGFDFGSPSTLKALTGKLDAFKKYNGLGIPAEYFDEAMAKLRSERFLNKQLESVSHPVSDITKQVTEEQKITASEAPQVEVAQLTAEEWFERGYVFANDKNYNEAIRCFSESLLLKPDSAEVFISRGIMYRVNGELENAIRDYTDAIRLKPEDNDTLSLRAFAKIKYGDLEGAIQDSTEAIQLNPSSAGAYLNRGNARCVMGNFKGAIDDCNEAIRLEKESAEAYLSRGNVYRTMGDLDNAIADYNESICLDATVLDSYINRGLAYLTNNNLESAIQDYTEVIRLKPQSEYSYMLRSLAYKAKGNFEQAIADLNEAICIKPDFAEAFSSLGKALMGLKRNDEAEAAYRKTIELNPADDTAYYNLACLKSILGNASSALEYLEKALANGFDRAWAKQDPDLENIRNDPRFKELVGE